MGTTCTRTQVVVNPQPDEPLVTPGHEVMGGDEIGAYYEFSTRGLPTNSSRNPSHAGTLTLGGLTTDDGIRGFVMSGHGAFLYSIDRYKGFMAGKTDVLIFDDSGKRTRNFDRVFRTFLGKVMQLPHPRTVGNFDEFFYADAAFVAYPSTRASDCSLVWTTNNYTDTNRTFCLDLGKGTQIETVTPLTIRGKNDATYNVVGSTAPTMGLDVMFSGATSGLAHEGNRVTSGAILTRLGNEGGVDYTYDMAGGQVGQPGDSGSPIYTEPDKHGNVQIVGIIQGVYAEEGITVFNSWDDVMKEFDLQPIQ